MSLSRSAELAERLIFFVTILYYFVQSSMQMNQFGPQSMNINQQMIRTLLQNVTVLLLFILPMITMRTYAEEKRSGTIELLLTSPLTDFQIIMGKFLGALALYAVMLLITMVHIGLLFVYGKPEWKPIVSANTSVPAGWAHVSQSLLGMCFSNSSCAI